MSQFSPDLRRFAITLVNLQQRRHEADYNPGTIFDQTQVTQIIDYAENALAGFNNAPTDEIRLFIAYLTSRARRS
jgi:selenocysteine lyase/cysteine desulfurase